MSESEVTELLAITDRLAKESQPLTAEELAELASGKLAPVAGASRIIRAIGELRQARAAIDEFNEAHAEVLQLTHLFPPGTDRLDDAFERQQKAVRRLAQVRRQANERR